MNLSDPQTFARAYAEHFGGVYGTALRVLKDPVRAQDVAQDVFVRVWRRPRTFDAGRGELGSYLRLMARSRALDVWREGQAAGRALDRQRALAARAQDRPDERPAEAAERADDRAAVHAALRALPQPQREAIVLSHWAGLTADEIARHAGIPLGTAKSRLRLGMAKLRGDAAVLAAA
jgi:RNA polymerase sigma-70 factor (ECF subfamily)